MKRRRGVAHWRGHALRDARVAAGLTQAELAHQISVAEWTVVAWEGDRRQPRPAHLAALATALRLDPASLVATPPKPTMRELRERVALSTNAVADAVGVSPNSVLRVENARWWPTAAEQWAKLYGVSLDELRAAWERSQPH